jgi:hypothetical protein
MTAAQNARRFGRRGRRVLYRLGFIQDHVVELVLGETRRIAPQRSVRGEDEVVVADRSRRSRLAGVVEYAQARCEPRRLVHPVVDQRPGNDSNRCSRRIRFSRHAAVLEQGQHHNGLAEAHVIGQASSESKPAEERKPPERELLIVAQAPAKRRRRGHGANAVELRQLRAGPRERVVDAHRGLRFEQRVEKRGL